MDVKTNLHQLHISVIKLINSLQFSPIITGDVSSISRSTSRDNMLSLKGLSSTTADTSLSTPNLTKSKSTTNLRHDDNTTTPSKNDANKPRHLRQQNTAGQRRGSAASRSTSNLTTTEKPTASNGRSMSRDSLLTSTTSSNDSLSKSKSTQDIRRSTTPDNQSGTPGKRRNTADPQYVICQICGKLYSKHSIGIHQRSCERTYQKQKTVGTNVEYKIKSRSLVDLSNTNSKRTTLSQANAAANNNKSAKRSPSPASANPINGLKHGSASLSVSTGNLGPSRGIGTTGPSYQRRLLTNQNKKAPSSDVTDGTTPSNSNNGSGDTTKLSPGLQKCYLCRQLYGTRSLPIHEKQCLKKWERAQEEEKKKKKKNKKSGNEKDIQIMAFGRSKYEGEEENIENDIFGEIDTSQKSHKKNGNDIFGNKSESLDSLNGNDVDILINGKAESTGVSEIDSNDEYETESTIIQKPTTESSHTRKPIVAPLPSQLFGVSSPLPNPAGTTKRSRETTAVNGVAQFSIRKLGKSAETENSVPGNNGRPRFVVCVYCSKQFGSHSITIHEKSCREKQKLESKTRDRLALHITNSKKNTGNDKTPNKNVVSGLATTTKTSPGKKLSKSIGDIPLMEAFTTTGGGGSHGDSSVTSGNELTLVRCEECTRKFLKSDIEKHRMYCRVSVL